MIHLFYHIYQNREGGFVYHEFKSCYGWIGADAYSNFGTREAAENYAKQRGGVDAYSW